MAANKNRFANKTVSEIRKDLEIMLRKHIEAAIESAVSDFTKPAAIKKLKNMEKLYINSAVEIYDKPTLTTRRNKRKR